MTHEVQVAIPYFNALPRDCATNVLHFNRIGAPPTELELLGLVNTISAFYEEVYSIGETFAAYGDPAHVHFKIYDLADPTPRAPKLDYVGVITVEQQLNTVLPPEVAVVESIHGAGISGTPIASQRGRLYIGVLGDLVCSTGGATNFPTVDEGFRTVVNGAANTLVGAAVTAGFTWVILSRKLSTTYPVVGGHCDDAFDIQRRRGQDPVIRNTWP